MVSVTKRVEIEVDLEDYDTDEIVRELRDRARSGDREAKLCVGSETPLLDGMDDWTMESLRSAMLNDDGRRVIDLLRPYLLPYPSGVTSLSVLPFRLRRGAR